MPYFLCRLAAPRPSFPFDMSEEEAALMAQHGAFWQERARARQAIAVGPVLDQAGAWGLAIVEAADEAATRVMTEADPVIVAGRGFSYSIHPMPALILREAGPAN